MSTLVSTILAFGCVTPLWAATTSQPASAPAIAPAQVVILGTLHGGHDSNPSYSTDTLRDIILAMKPAAILLELPPQIGTRQTVENGRVIQNYMGNEAKACNQAADALGVNVIPFDREGRNEYYRQTNYFARQKDANEGYRNWLQAQSKKAPDSPPVRALQLLGDALGNQRKLDARSGPEKINSAAYDMIIATKHQIMFGMIPTVLAAAGRRELSGEFRYLAEEWQVRNAAMARNIASAARQFPGKRLVVVTGSEHRYILRDLLAKAPEAELKEFYEVAEWTGTRPAQ